MRIRLKKPRQRYFIKKVLILTNCPSLAELSRRINISYSTLKNYFNESRLIPEELFSDLCILSKMNKSDFEFEILNDNWGKVKGGKIKR